MRRGNALKKLIGYLMILCLFLAVAPVKVVLCEGNEIDQRLDELGDLQQQINELQRQVDSKKNDEDSVMSELDDLQNQLSLSTKELEYLEMQASVTADQLTETRTQVADMQQKLADQKEAFDSRLISMYKASRISYIDILLSSGSLSQFMSRLHYLRQIAVQDTGLISEYKANHDTLVAKQQELEEYAVKLTSLTSSQEQKRAEVTSRSADRATYLASIQSDKAKLEQSLDEMQRQADALNRVIADLQAKGHKAQTHTLSMIWPATGGWITSYYGNRYHPILGYYKFHSGIDYALDEGIPIHAMEDGTVIFAGWNGGYGNCVIIDHGGGVSTLYGHASRLLVSTGQNVVQGQTIALVGTTGLSTGPHLHFEVRVNGETQDPLSWLP